MAMLITSNVKQSNYQISSEERIKKANDILYEYFRNNRYPKKIEKLRLAEKANVTLQFVINFFYTTRSRIKNIEKLQYNNYNSSMVAMADKDFVQYYWYKNNQKRFKGAVMRPLSGLYNFMNGNKNNLYKSPPTIMPVSFYECDSRECEDIKFTKVQISEDLNNENISNTSNIH